MSARFRPDSRPAARLGRRLVLEAPTHAPDGAGGLVAAWAPLGALWADIAFAAPRASGRPGADAFSLPVRITVRAMPSASPQRPRPGQRLREGARLFLVDAVAEADGEGRFLLVHAREEDAP